MGKIGQNRENDEKVSTFESVFLQELRIWCSPKEKNKSKKIHSFGKKDYYPASEMKFKSQEKTFLDCSVSG